MKRSATTYIQTIIYLHLAQPPRSDTTRVQYDILYRLHTTPSAPVSRSAARATVGPGRWGPGALSGARGAQWGPRARGARQRVTDYATHATIVTQANRFVLYIQKKISLV